MTYPHHTTPSPEALRQALFYLTPHPLTKAPVVLQADELRQAVETISAALGTVAEEPGDAVEGEGWQTEDIRSLIDEAGVTFDSSEMIEKVSQYGGPGTLVGWHFSDPEDGVRKLSALIRLALRVRMSFAAAPKANGVGTGEEGWQKAKSVLVEAVRRADANADSIGFDKPYPDETEIDPLFPSGDHITIMTLGDLRFAAQFFTTPSQTKPPALAAKPEGEKASAGEVLADLIRTRLLGVRPDDQDLDLEDEDWRLILAALTTTGSGGRAEEGLTETQFIVQIALHIMESGNLPAAEGLPKAAAAYRQFLTDNRISFGDAAYAWDEAAAVIVGREYETGYWEAAPAALVDEEAGS